MVRRLTKKRERRREQELEKSASQTRSIVEIFSVQHNKDLFHHEDPVSGTTPAISVPEIIKKKGVDQRWKQCLKHKLKPHMI